MREMKIWIAAFLLFLILPAVLYTTMYDHIDHENHENREYSAFPDLSAENYPVFSTMAEAYYNDRVPFKNQFKALHTRIEQWLQKYESRYSWMTMTPPALQGQEGWLFYMARGEEEDPVSDYNGLNRYTQAEMERYGEKLQMLSDYYEKQGIDFIYLVVPGKESVYTEYMPEYYPDRASTTRFEEYIGYLQNNTSVKALYPREALRDKRKECDLYFKKDSHWNLAGAYVGVKTVTDLLDDSLMAALEDAGPFVTGTREGGDLSDLLGIPGPEAEDQVVGLENFWPDVSVTEPTEGERHSISDSADRRKVLVLGDSFSSRMYDILSKVFAEVWVARGTGRAKEILYDEKYEPDILIWETAERYYNRMEWPDILMGSVKNDQEAEGFDAR